jgi:hypothetical protein
MTKLRRVLAKCALVGASLLVGLFLVELGVRFLGLYKFPAHNFVERHSKLGWSHVPNKEGWYDVEGQRIDVRINSKGLRDREYSYEKPKGVFRILVLGDSFAEAFQVPLADSFSEVLEKALNQTGAKFEVINAGFAGVGTDYELLFFRHEGYRYDPDLVLLAFFGNDIYDNFRSKNLLKDRTASIAYEEVGLVSYVKGFLAQNSCAYNYLAYVLSRHMPTASTLLMKLGLLSSAPIDDTKGEDLLQLMVFAGEYGPKWKKAWDVTRVLISQLEQETEARGSDLAVFCIPYIDQVYESVWQSRLTSPGLKEREWDLEKPERLLAGFLEDNSIPFLELLSQFREAAGRMQLYYPKDGHWNARGHHLAANLIFDWLLEEGLVPTETETRGLNVQR